MRAVFNALRSRLLKLGLFRAVQVGEPMSPPEGMTAALILDSYAAPSATLSGLVEERVVTVRIYDKAITGDSEARELRMDSAATAVLRSLFEEPTLGGAVRIPNVGRLSVRFGYQTIGQAMYRVADVSVPLTVDDIVRFGP